MRRVKQVQIVLKASVQGTSCITNRIEGFAVVVCPFGHNHSMTVFQILTFYIVSPQIRVEMATFHIPCYLINENYHAPSYKLRSE